MSGKPHLATCLSAVEEAITEAQTAQMTHEGNVLRLESFIGYLRNLRGMLLDLMEEP